MQLVCLAGCLASFRVPLRTTAQVLALYSTIGAAGAFVLFGHARAASPTWATVPADVVHVVCAAVWLGGLIGLVVVLRARTAAARLAGEIAPAESAATGPRPRPSGPRLPASRPPPSPCSTVPPRTTAAESRETGARRSRSSSRRSPPSGGYRRWRPCR